MRRILFALAITLLLVSTASAQPCGPISPTPVALTPTSIVCFEPSPDHYALIGGMVNQPAVTEYAWEVYLKDAQSPFWSTSLGKPNPGGDGAIRVLAPSVPGMARFQEHTSKVVAVGPTGSGRSEASNGFFSAPAPAPAGRPVIGPS